MATAKRSRRWRWGAGLAALGVAALLALPFSSLLPGPPDTAAPAPSAPPQRFPLELQQRLDSEGLTSLLGTQGSGGAPVASPSGLTELMSRLEPQLPRPTLPEPASEAPVAAALAEYARVMEVPLPPLPQLNASILGLGLGPQGERALAQLVLAYTQAVQMQRAATAGLSEEERRFVGLDPAAATDWFNQHPNATWEEYELAIMQVLDAKGNRALTLLAGDLLARAVDAARGPLSQDQRPLPLPPEPRQQLGTLPTGTQAAADAASLVGSFVRLLGPAPSQASTEPSNLREALIDLHHALGLPTPPPSAVEAALPPSLDQAVARIVAAKTLGARGGSPVAEALAFLEATERARPILEAWADVFRLTQHEAARPLRQASASALLGQAISGEPGVAQMVADGQGLAALPPLDPPPPVTRLLLHEGMEPAQAAAAAALLPPEASMALAWALSGLQAFDAEVGRVLEPLPPAQRDAVLRNAEIQVLMQDRNWGPHESQLVKDWARGMMALDGGSFEAIARARSVAVASIEQAALLLGPLSQPAGREPAAVRNAQDQIMGIAGRSTGAGAGPMPCPSGTSVPGVGLGTDCSNDVWLNLPTGRGILLTGWGRSQIDGRYMGGNPGLTIDLGGDDTYTIRAGGTSNLLTLQQRITPATRPQPPTLASVTIDADGSDKYVASDAGGWSFGSAIGYASLGVLWDRDGNDQYLSNPPLPPLGLVEGSQGFGGLGGLGILVDEAGIDLYHAPTAYAHGAAWMPNLPLPGASTAILDYGVLRSSASMGMLLDLGPGDDSFHAARGQGYGIGDETVGMLFDEEGPTRYTSSSPNQASPGGRDSRGGLGLFVDLGGAGDVYGNLFLPPQDVVVAFESDNLRRRDDAMWLDGDNALAIGLDSTLGNAGDGDPCPNLLELLLGSNPKATDCPGMPNVSPATLQKLLERQITPFQTDSDEDGFSDGLEAGAGTNPEDPTDHPQATLQAIVDGLGKGILFEDGQDGTLNNPRQYCYNNAGTCDTVPLSMLRIGGIDDNQYDRYALVHVDLGGNDKYLTEIAGSAPIRAQGTVVLPALGSYAIDADGDDEYDTPTRAATQGSIVGNPVSGSIRNAGVSILWDFNGTDLYAAAGLSQGYSNVGIGLLIDGAGNDRYEGGNPAQGSDPINVGLAGLFDLAGDDDYLFARQGSLLNAQGFAVVYDHKGRDRYNSSTTPIQTVGLTYDNAVSFNAGAAFSTQGFTRHTGQVGNFGLALFADNGPEIDTYVTLNQTGSFADVSDAKNNQQLIATNGNSGTSFGFFVDGLNLDVGDPDDDGTPSFVEGLAGSNPQDGSSHPGNLLQAAYNPDLNNTDSQQLLGLNQSGPWLRATPRPFNGLRLPGLIIGGRADDIHSRWASFLVDLGGNDQYTAPYMGGVVPPENGLARNVQRTTDVPPSDVVLLLDVSPSGQPGDDVYAPAPCNHVVTANNHVIVPPGEGIVRNSTAAGRTYAMPAACPSLGGALNGVAMVADDGGHNQFRSGMTLHSTVISNSAKFNNQVAGWGVTQGAGLFDGVGVLATWNATNDFAATLNVTAREIGAIGLPTPISLARGVAQGATEGGYGILANFGMGQDTYDSHVEAHAKRSGNQDVGVAEGGSQGAGLSGTAILLDEGGANHFRSPQGFSQGSAIVAFSPTNTVLLGAPQAYGGQPLPFGTGATPDSGFAGLSRSSVGLLWSGSSDDLYEGGRFSQGTGFARSTNLATFPNQLGQAWPTNIASKAGVLVDWGGNDIYRVATPTSLSPLATACPPPANLNCSMSQGAGLLEGFGFVLEMAGDDRYEASQATHVQGIGVMGTGLLLDYGGHDFYAAQSHAQGYAAHVASPLFSNSQIILQATTTGQVLGVQPQLWDEGTRAGALLDLGGWDAYVASDKAQGYGEMASHNLSSLQTCYQINTRVPYTCNSAFQGCVTFCPSAVFGVFYDASGNDRYTYPSDRKTSVPTGSPPPGDGNRWNWTQTDDGAPIVVVGLGMDRAEMDEVYANLQTVYDNLRPVAEILVKPFQFPGSVEIDLARDAAESNLIDPTSQMANGTIYLVARLKLASTFDRSNVQRVDFLIDNVLFGKGIYSRTTQNAGTAVLHYVLPWRTMEPGELPGAERFPDGTYSVVATAFITPNSSSAVGDNGTSSPAPGVTDRRPVSSPELPSIQSAVKNLRLDNPPRVKADLSQSRISTNSTPPQTSTLHIQLGGDYGEPDAGAPAPSGNLTVTATRLVDGTTTTLFTAAHVPAGPMNVSLDGKCAGQVCADGLYRINVTVEDARKGLGAEHGELLMEGTSPTSRLAMPAVATGKHRSGLNGLVVSWNYTDVPVGLRSEDASGVQKIAILQLDSQGEPVTGCALTNWCMGLFQAPQRSGILPGLITGDTVRLLSVATDALGHSESPCLANEAPPCYRAKLQRQPAAVTDVVVDFEKPVLSNLAASAFYVKPGAPISFSVRATDTPGSGVNWTLIRFSSGLEALMHKGPGDVYRYDHWGGNNTLDPSDEQWFSYTIVAEDNGGNQKILSSSGVMDSLPPRVTPLDSTYANALNGPTLSAGRSGTKVVVLAKIADAAVASAKIDLAPLQPWNPLKQSCAPSLDTPGIWLCDIVIPANATDGEYALSWIVRDQAGNEATGEYSRVKVSNVAPGIQDLRVVDVQHDGFTVRWSTDLDATARVRYGRTTDLAFATLPGTTFGQAHEVTVRGLSPSAGYFVRVEATSRSGAGAESGLIGTETLNAYTLQVANLPAGSIRSGRIELQLLGQLIVGTQAADVSVRIQDAQSRASPLPLGQAVVGQGVTPFLFDSVVVPDGDYRVLLQGSRSGDFAQFTSPVFRIDNTHPVISPLHPPMGGWTVQSRPLVALSVFDPLVSDLPPLEGLDVRLDGAPLTAVQPSYFGAGSGSGRRLAFTLPVNLTEGRHELEVRLPDLANNMGSAKWNFTVDTHAPRLTSSSVVYLPGPTAARPGGSVRVNATFNDRAGVHAALADLGAWGGIVPLKRQANGNWTGDINLSMDTPHGTWKLPVYGIDVRGNQGESGMLRIEVDAQAPRVQFATLHPQGFTALHLEVRTDEPVRAKAQTGNATTATTEYANTHRLALSGLAPGQRHAVTFHLVDGAGNLATGFLNATTPLDAQAPTAVQLRWEPNQAEGTVRLAWEPAQDNAGIAAYRVERSDGGAWRMVALLGPEATSFVEQDVPAGALVSYRVSAVDVSGLRGPDAEVQVRVVALPRLQAADVAPRTGPAEQPFAFRVTYRHAGGVLPQTIEAWHGDLRVPLSPLEPGADCRHGCDYGAQVRLPPGGVTGVPPRTGFTVVADGQTASIELDWSPRVLAGGGAGLHIDDPASRATPLPAFLFLVGALCLALALSPKRRTPA